LAGEEFLVNDGSGDQLREYREINHERQNIDGAWKQLRVSEGDLRGLLGDQE
jgi:hypothetical protein